MPAIEVTLDGIKIATVSTDGLDVLAVNIGGTQIDEDVASLDVSGGSYPKDGPSTSLTWISCKPLHKGQRVHVCFLQSGQSSHAGKTLEELFPDEPISKQSDFTPTAEIFGALRAKPKLHEKFSLQLVSSSGTSFSGESAANEHGFGFSVLWNSFHPERARVSLHAYTLDSLESRGPFNNFFEERIALGCSVELRVS